MKDWRDVTIRILSEKIDMLEAAVIQDYIESFGSEARWLKAIQRRREDGELLHAPQDIGPLIKIINQDMIDEEEENIKDFFYKQFIKEILRSATRGFPYWYKDWLANNGMSES